MYKGASMATIASTTLDSMNMSALSVEAAYAELKQLNSKSVALQLLTGDASINTMPKYIGFTTTTFCNLSCVHCLSHGVEERRKIFNSQHWRPELIARLAAESLPTADEFNLTLSGEPLTTPGYNAQLKQLAPFGAKLTMTTNAMLFRKASLIESIPIASTISISVDGATKFTIEKIRKGTRFEQLLTNIRLLTRTCELLPPEKRPHVQFTCVLMGSNLREMPQVVRMARALNVNTVIFSPIIVHYDLAKESLSHHRDLFKAMLLESQEEAARLKINLLNSVPLQELEPPAQASSSETAGRMIIQDWPSDYSPCRPSYDDVLNHEEIEAQANEIAQCIQLRSRELSETSSVPLEDLVQAREALHTSIEKHSLESLQSKISQQPTMRYCDYLHKRIFFGIDGQVYPCCSSHPSRPSLGNVHKQSVRSIWNGERYWQFRRSFQSSEMPECCRDCRWASTIKTERVFQQLIS
jgi:radical SAM protein with 4Fe4S-binding SPASM domain